MKRLLFLQALPCLFLASCSVSEIETENVVPQQEDVFFACSEHCSDTDTKVYVDENVKILWDEDDRITIFNKFSYNQEYRFAGDAGDNSGAFKKVPNDDFVTGNELDNIFAVYPYQESTRISNRSVLTVTLPTEQLYRENSFGRGANVMTSAGNDNMLRFRNIGGFLVLKFYGGDVSVSSIRLEGNNAEPLSGRATVTQEVGTNPSVIMATSAESSITLSCETPVALGGTKEDAVAFWFVLPPTEFTKGFTLTVTNENGDTFVKKTERKMTVNRNGVLRISPIEVVIEPGQQTISFADPGAKDFCIANWDTDGDGELSYDEAAAVTSLDAIARYRNKGSATVESFDEFRFFSGVTVIPEDCFSRFYSLKSIILPPNVSTIGDRAFEDCVALSSIVIPERVTEIGEYAFSHTALTEVILPPELNKIRLCVFSGCHHLEKVGWPLSLKEIDQQAFEDCGFESVSIPEGVTRVGGGAFSGCTSLTKVSLPESLSDIDSFGVFDFCPKLSSFIGKYASPDGRLLVKDDELLRFAPSGLTHYSIPEGVKSIGYSSFRDCPELVSVTIPEGVESIKDGAFFDCEKLTSMVFPKSVTSIESIYGYNENLSAVVFQSEIPPTVDSAFFTHQYIEVFSHRYIEENIRVRRIIDSRYSIFVPLNYRSNYIDAWVCELNYTTFGDLQAYCDLNWITGLTPYPQYQIKGMCSDSGDKQLRIYLYGSGNVFICWGTGTQPVFLNNLAETSSVDPTWMSFTREEIEARYYEYDWDGMIYILAGPDQQVDVSFEWVDDDAG